jgi:hypothetical protein
MDMGRPDLRLLSERRLRLANSSLDVKALFNSPAYIYNLEALEAALSVGSGDDIGYAKSCAGRTGEGDGYDWRRFGFGILDAYFFGSNRTFFLSLSVFPLCN